MRQRRNPIPGSMGNEMSARQKVILIMRPLVKKSRNVGHTNTEARQSQIDGLLWLCAETLSYTEFSFAGQRTRSCDEGKRSHATNHQVCTKAELEVCLERRTRRQRLSRDLSATARCNGRNTLPANSVGSRKTASTWICWL